MRLQITLGVSAFTTRAGVRPGAQVGKPSDDGRRRRPTSRMVSVQTSFVTRELRKLLQYEPGGF
jgi:hypothetical protein